MVETLAELDKAFDELRFDDMADAIYHFTWGTFCDWYVELVKGAFDEETKRVAAWAFDQILVMLHPFMPFVTEELWNANERPYELIVAKWPAPEAQTDPRAKAEIEWLIELVSEIRSARTELNVPPSAKLHLFATNAPDETADRLDRLHAMLSRLARLESIQLSSFDGMAPRRSWSGRSTFALPLEGVIDLERRESAPSTRPRLLPKRSATASRPRLANPNFTERAKPEAVEKARSDHEEKSAEAERYRAALERLG